MKIFVSWSGKLSYQVALILQDWLKSVLPTVEPFVSSENIRKGERWGETLDSELESTNYAIVCLTPNNLDSTWLHYESGAVSKSIDKSNVTPFLFLVDREDVTGPLSRFQSTIIEKDDIRRLVYDINEKLETRHRTPEPSLRNSFKDEWPKLEKSFAQLIDTSRYAYHGLKLNKLQTERGVVLLQHRATHGDMLTKALTSKVDILLLSIMPENLARDIDSMIARDQFKANSFRLLMLNKGLTKGQLTAIGAHLSESNDKSVQIDNSWNHWEKLSRRNKSISLCGYSSSPMFQITLVVGDWMTIEIIPYGVGTQKRPALFITKESNPSLFEQISSSVEDLWDINKKTI